MGRARKEGRARVRGRERRGDGEGLAGKGEKREDDQVRRGRQTGRAWGRAGERRGREGSEPEGQRHVLNEERTDCEIMLRLAKDGMYGT